MNPDKRIKPTEGELEILQVLWDRGPCTVREVHETLSQHREMGYTTALKLLQIMFDKGLVERDESSRSHIYRYAVSREETQQHLLGKMIKTLFAGSPGQLVMQALGNHQASEAELNAIRALLDELKKR